MKAIVLAKSKVLGKIEEAKGECYDVTFIKVDGTRRQMLAKQNVQHNLKGCGNRVVKNSNDYISTFDCRATAYRTINLATVVKLTVNGVKYKVV